ncbi:MAG: HAD family hydrolase [Oleispira antarctica]|uniref:HAD family hydrolase (Haloacid dehalogenase) n=1 Tax=Oleispira antarctica RB-8 TaxID=698738 RepID=R4YQ98_OLEAN|nr:HAD family hydrolase [Oleispira antarctica]MBQ0791037.1 HAD family hydrolase [Oleispira antarctica]CCK74309.1 HAD family hydrolase (Haloacid dehalogenase) [Oleispira antarctica RB-8]
MALAIFDLDHTLLSGDSDHAWGQFLVDKKIVDPSHYEKQNNYFYEQYKAGGLDINEYLTFALKPLTENSLASMLSLREEFIEYRIKPLITQKARDLIARHQQSGDDMLIITATNAFITRPIATLLGFDDLIAPEPEIINGQYTGGITGIPSFHQGKVTRLEMWLEEKEMNLTGAFFYSDSHNDLPLLNLVDKPIAVNADEILTDTATRNGWPIISLRDA